MIYALKDKSLEILSSQNSIKLPIFFLMSVWLQFSFFFFLVNEHFLKFDFTNLVHFLPSPFPSCSSNFLFTDFKQSSSFSFRRTKREIVRIFVSLQNRQTKIHPSEWYFN